MITFSCLLDLFIGIFKLEVYVECEGVIGGVNAGNLPNACLAEVDAKT